ncbi:hypothetical protein B0H13DRAFT_1900304 [Mycena leptocephala]|nr:hypothetical protein B0H13DRAFT_1900304 [Mycena leptocephala]
MPQPHESSTNCISKQCELSVVGCSMKAVYYLSEGVQTWSKRYEARSGKEATKTKVIAHLGTIAFEEFCLVAFGVGRSRNIGLQMVLRRIFELWDKMLCSRWLTSSVEDLKEEYMGYQLVTTSILQRQSSADLKTSQRRSNHEELERTQLLQPAFSVFVSELPNGITGNPRQVAQACKKK